MMGEQGRAKGAEGHVSLLLLWPAASLLVRACAYCFFARVRSYLLITAREAALNAKSFSTCSDSSIMSVLVVGRASRDT